MAVALGPPKFAPARGLEFLFQLEGVADLLHLKLNDLVVDIAVGVALGEDSKSLLVLALGNQETWRFWDSPDEEEPEKGWEGLDERWSSPCPISNNVVGAKSEPCGNNGSEVPGGVVDGGENGTMLSVG